MVSIWDYENALERIKELDGVEDYFESKDHLIISVNVKKGDDILKLVKQEPKNGTIKYNYIHYLDLDHLENLTVMYDSKRNKSLSVWLNKP